MLSANLRQFERVCDGFNGWLFVLNSFNSIRVKFLIHSNNSFWSAVFQSHVLNKFCCDVCLVNFCHFTRKLPRKEWKTRLKMRFCHGFCSNILFRCAKKIINMKKANFANRIWTMTAHHQTVRNCFEATNKIDKNVLSNKEYHPKCAHLKSFFQSKAIRLDLLQFRMSLQTSLYPATCERSYIYAFNQKCVYHSNSTENWNNKIEV